MDEKKIHSIIDEAMAARDRSVSIYISPDGGVSVSVFPWPNEETLRNMRASGLISHEEGLAMARIRLGDKFSRFKTLSRLSCNDSDQQQVTDESIRDTLLDLANYAIMTVLEMDTPDESHATLYAYDKPICTVVKANLTRLACESGEDK